MLPQSQRPKLVIISIGKHAPSQIYIRKKQEACTACGILSQVVSFDETVDFDTLSETLTALNADDSVTGIIVQTPLPQHIIPQDCFNLIAPQKDVDGLSATNAGLLALGNAHLTPATPLGIMRILNTLGVVPRGKEAVVVGRSHLVGRPLAELLSQQEATVISCHKETLDVPAHTRKADIVIVATGVGHLLNGKDFKKGAIVIDVGISPNPEPAENMPKIIGDVDTESCKGIVSVITPVPGGVGPMTVASLMTNVIDAYCLQSQRSKPVWLPSGAVVGL